VTRRERVDALLAELEQLRQRVYLLQAGGALPAGLRDATADLAAARERLLSIL
jgi:hypothetical protein